jgi:ABC-2 type transport system ATP-binding protein
LNSPVYVLVGPNGAGKTTALSMISGLLQPDGGKVTVAGERMSAKAYDLRARLGMVPQNLAIFPDLTAEENLRFFGSLYGLRREALRSRVNSALGFVGLGERGKERVSTFSGGMQRRLNVAAALVHEPDVLLLDEPTAGVDPQSRNLLLENVGRLRDAGKAVLYTTHYMEEAERLADRIGVLDGGKLIAEGTQRELQRLVGGLDQIRVRFSRAENAAIDACRSVPGVTNVTTAGRTVTVSTPDAGRALANLVRAAQPHGLVSIEVVEPGLEQLFLTLTGRSLRD